MFVCCGYMRVGVSQCVSCVINTETFVLVAKERVLRWREREREREKGGGQSGGEGGTDCVPSTGWTRRFTCIRAKVLRVY